jgi:gliding motility-associated-like protein
MRRKSLLFLFLLPFLKVWSQNPATVFTIPSRNVTLPCGTTCTTISASVPHVKQTNDYLITSIPYLPFAYTTPGGTELTEVYIDDRWSEKIPITFPFCFYGITYPTLLMGSNSIITFDSARAGDGSGYTITTGTPIPNNSSTNVYAPASIFGPYHDINPSTTNNPAPTNRKIEYRVEGTAPKRRFIASYNEVIYFNSTNGSCNTYKATHMMVLYESTGIIEVYIQDKPSCPDWNTGLAILGVQDETQTKAVAATGKNATVWGSTGMNEAYRFTPSGGVSRFKRAQLLVNNNVIAQADTASGDPGMLNLNFNNVCPTLDSTAYVLRVTYGLCNDPSQDVSFDDTVRIKRPTPIVSLTTTNQTCVAGGTITISLAGNPSGFQFSLNGGTLQSGSTFSNLNAGTYSIGVQSGSCSASSLAIISLVNNLSVNVLPADTSVCAGASFTPRVTTNATTYSWTPTSAVNPANILQPLVTPTSNGQYILTASTGPCVINDTVNVTVFQSTPVNAGPDLTIISGDMVQLLANGSAGSTYVWTPASGLSAANVLRPNASPTATTTYTLRQTTAQGCTSQDEMTVTVLSCVDPMIAFTPNGDGINDRWLVTNSQCLKSAKVEVFNRYGNKVFEDANYSNQWDGNYKGKPLPDGTYYYVVTYTLINGKPTYIKGNVTILR